jgi:hypothetical protein
MKRDSSNSLTSQQTMKRGASGSSGSLTSQQSMKRGASGSSGSNTSLASIPSINSQKDFQNYIENTEDDIINISNDYYYFTEKYDKKINNIVDRYEGRTNKIFIDLRCKEADFARLSNKIDIIVNDLTNIKKNINYPFYIPITLSEKNCIDKIYSFILVSLYVYPICMFIIINYYTYRMYAVI